MICHTEKMCFIFIIFAVFFLMSFTHCSLEAQYNDEAIQNQKKRLRIKYADIPKDQICEVLIQHLAETQNINRKLAEEEMRLKLEIGKLKKYKMTEVVLGRIEQLEHLLVLPQGANSDSRYVRWILILHLGTLEANQILHLVQTEYYPNDKERSISVFAKTLEAMYPDWSKDGLNKYVNPVVLDEIRNATYYMMIEILEICGIPYNYDKNYENYIKAFKILSYPLDELKNIKTSEAEPEYFRFKCVILSPLAIRFPKDKNITQNDVNEFFPVTRPLSTKFHCNETFFKHNITVKFESTAAAVEALNCNHGWINKIEVRSHLSMCD